MKIYSERAKFALSEYNVTTKMYSFYLKLLSVVLINYIKCVVS